MQITHSPGRFEVHDVTWVHWGGGALTGTAAAFYGRAILTGDGHVSWQLLTMLVGVAVFLCTRPALTTTFDVKTRLAVHRWRYLFLSGSEDIDFDRIAGVGNDISVDSETNLGHQRIRLKLKSGRTPPLTVWTRNSDDVARTIASIVQVLS